MKLLSRIAMLAAVVGRESHAYVFDEVVFGNMTSEKAHNLVGEGIQRGITPDHRSYVVVNKSGILNLTMQCAPFLTVEFWGDDYLEGNEIVTVIPQIFGGEVSACSYPPELNLCLTDRNAHDCLGGVSPGRSQVVTLPTQDLGNCSGAMTLSLVSLGVPRTLAAFRVFAHEAQPGSGGMFDPDDTIIPQGSFPSPAPPRTNSAIAQVDFLKGQVTAGGEWMAAFQAWGSNWSTAVSAGLAPAGMSGAVFRGGWGGLLGKDTTVWQSEWSTGSTSSNNNWFRALTVFARFHLREVASRRAAAHSEAVATSTVWLDRVIAGLDLLRRAQGANGGYDGRGGGYTFIGGPNRLNASGVLEGYGHMGISDTVHMLLEAKDAGFSAALQGSFDDDNDPGTPNVTRLSGYVDLLRDSRDYLLSHGGHAPNQQMADRVSALTSDACLAVLAPAAKLPTGNVTDLARQAIGLLPTDIYPDTPWISTMGISMEPNGRLNGGFSAGYGDMAWMTDRLAAVVDQVSGSDVVAKSVNFTDALSKLRYPDNCYDFSGNGTRILYRCLRLESAITWRHNKNPGQVSFGGGGGFFGALQAKNPVAIRLVQLRMEMGDVYSLHLDGEEDAASPHFATRLTEAADLYDSWDSISGLSTATRLPFEEGQPDFAFVDAMAALGVARIGNDRLFIAMQWRHWFNTTDPSQRKPSTVVLNDLVRVHYVTEGVDRVAVVPMQLQSPSTGFAEVWAALYGKFFLGMHTGLASDNDPPLQLVIPPDIVGMQACNLVSQVTIVALPESLTLQPQQSLFVHAGVACA